jgi:hypothetical protein
MAIENTIEVATPLPLDDIKRILMAEYGLEEGRPLPRATELRSEGFWCYLIPEDKLGKEIIAEAFGFVPSLEVRLRHRKDTFAHKPFHEALIDITLILLTYLQDDLVVLESGEIGQLLRLGGAITIHDDKYWKPCLSQALAGFGFEFQVGNVPRL